MYSPGNSVIVNLCMRFPTVAVIAGVCGAAYFVESKINTPPPPAPIPVVTPLVPVVTPPPVVQQVVVPPAPTLPVLKCKKNHHVHNGHCVRG